MSLVAKVPARRTSPLNRLRLVGILNLLELATPTTHEPVPSESSPELNIDTPLISSVGKPTRYAEAPDLFSYGAFPEFSAFTLHHGVRELAGRADFQAKTTSKEVFIVDWLLRLSWPVLRSIVLWPPFYFEEVYHAVGPDSRSRRCRRMGKCAFHISVRVIDFSIKIAAGES